MHEVGVARRVPGCVHERRQHHRDKRAEPRPAPEIAEHAVAVRDPEVAERLRRHDVDLRVRAQPLHRVGDETAGSVALPPGIRSRQNDDTKAHSTTRSTTQSA